MTNDDTMKDTAETAGRTGDDSLSSDGWERRYEAGETGWDRGETSPALLRWLDQNVLVPCRILVPGCGRGHEVIELASRGFDVTAIDFARTPVRELTHRLTQAGLIADVLRENVLCFATSDRFDAVYEQTSLCAIDPKHWMAYESRIFSNLKHGGQLFAVLMQSSKQQGPPFHCDPKRIKKVFHPSRWAWPRESFTIDHPVGMHEVAVVLTKLEK